MDTKTTIATILLVVLSLIVGIVIGFENHNDLALFALRYVNGHGDIVYVNDIACYRNKLVIDQYNHAIGYSTSDEIVSGQLTTPN